MNDHDLPTLFDVPPIDEIPVLPYGGTSGWSGSSTSKDRALEADSTGKTRQTQTICLDLLERTGETGLTWKELSEATGWHHGQASSVLSVLHKQGWIRRLEERRGRSQTYVLPDRTAGRPEASYQPNVSGRLLIEILSEIETDLEDQNYRTALRRIRATLESFGR